MAWCTMIPPMERVYNNELVPDTPQCDFQKHILIFGSVTFVGVEMLACYFGFLVCVRIDVVFLKIQLPFEEPRLHDM